MARWYARGRNPTSTALKLDMAIIQEAKSVFNSLFNSKGSVFVFYEMFRPETVRLSDGLELIRERRASEADPFTQGFRVMRRRLSLTGTPVTSYTDHDSGGLGNRLPALHTEQLVRSEVCLCPQTSAVR
ncbi:hypothetical protein CSKR_110547 [Clonorchis sinensis]|uniref:Uncharacterized protein n=1 Tax=Clonorchis sinensis TaxID=79923 RepID=A0A419Q4U7_CLOSI|nr:hypothetical protein CSKR_110547 [Clonorchis sinensis]